MPRAAVRLPFLFCLIPVGCQFGQGSVRFNAGDEMLLVFGVQANAGLNLDDSLTAGCEACTGVIGFKSISDLSNYRYNAAN
jgi:hypothetical protein